MIYLLVFLLVVINATGHLLLKIGSKKNQSSILMFLNIQSLLGYSFFLISTLLTVYLLKYIDFKSMTLVVTLNYIATLVLARFILKEKLSMRKYTALAIIILGIVVFNL